MDGTWNVYYEDRPVGSCCLYQEGLYIRFVCRCDRCSDAISRLVLRCGGETRDLGILVPVDGGLGLDRKLPSKTVPEGELKFSILIPERHSQGTFVPVKAGEKCLCLSRLAEARFAKQNGEAGLYFE